MRAHKALKIEVCEFIILLKFEEFLQLRISEDMATVLWVLKFVLTDVVINLTGDLSAGHLSAYWLAEESAEFIRDESWLGESTWCARSASGILGGWCLAAAAAVSFTHLTCDLAAEDLDISVERSLESLELGKASHDTLEAGIE